MSLQIETRKAQSLDLAAEALAIALFAEDVKEQKGLDKQVAEVLGSVLGSDFRGKKNEVFCLPTLGRLKPRRLVLAGLGKRSEFHADKIRQAAGAVAKAARRMGVATLTWDGASLSRLPGKAAENFQALAEGTHLGLYTFDRLKTKPKDQDEKEKPKLKSVELIFARGAAKEVEQALEKGAEISQAVNFVRDLVNSPANRMTPAMLADAAAQMAKSVQGGKIHCRVLEKGGIEKLGMNALLGVSRGSAQGPRFLILEYFGGKKSDRPVVLVGKGITFDSGGISLKPADGMEKMKYDMAGGAAVLGAVHAAARLKLPVNVVGLVPTCENMPGGNATKPGDVVKALNGKTIEVLNTDAEGRMILADALSYAARYKPKAAIDMATLTGACVVALGSLTCGLLGNDKKLIARVKEAAQRSEERAWELPLWDEYSEQIKSDVADVKNIGNREAGTITAAAFLKEFVEGYPWVHLDIAGVAWAESEKPYIPKGASGFGVRLVTAFLEDLAKRG